MAFAILRTKKLKTNGQIAAADSHNARKIDVPGLDPSRTKMNKSLGAESALNSVNSRLDEIVNASGKKIRSNAVRAVETMLTASPDFFDSIAPNWRDGQLGRINDWFDANVKFLSDFWGEKNVMQIQLHLDESTPHIHAIAVPELDCKLNCRAIIGGKEKLRQLQTDYADRMKAFGLERGHEKSNAHHIPIGQYHASKEQLKSLLPKPEKLLEYRGMDAGILKKKPVTRERRAIPFTSKNKSKITRLFDLAKAPFIAEEEQRRASEKMKLAGSYSYLQHQNEQLQNQLELEQKLNAQLTHENTLLRDENEQLKTSESELQQQLSAYQKEQKKDAELEI